MKTKIVFKIVRSAIVMIAMMAVNMGNAQTSYADQRDHIGLTASFGDQVSKLSSNYSAIDNMNLVEEGGSLGITWGSRSVDTKLTLGYYYSAACVPHTTDLIELGASANFYPLGFLTKRSHIVEPYFTGGISKNFYKMYGYYIGEENLPTNHSVSLEPHLGNMDVYMLTVGTGVMFNLYNSYDFLKLFADVKYGSPIMEFKSPVFNDTHLSKQIAVNIGVSVGFNR